MKSLSAFLLLLSLSLSVEFVKPDKILVLSFVSTKSHKITYYSLIEELAARGHDITVVTPVKADKPVKNIREIFTMDLEKSMKGFDAFEEKKQGKTSNPFFIVHHFLKVCNETYELPQVKQILNESYDLIFMQPLFNECAFGIVYRLKAPLVLFFPTTVPGIMAEKIGGYFPSSFVSGFAGYSDEMTFIQRCINFGVDNLLRLIMKIYYEPSMTAIYHEHLGNDIPEVSEIYANASLILSNGHFSLNRPKPYLPDIVDVGGLHSREAKPLPKDIEDFVSKSKDGFIFFSMGSAIKGDMMPEEKRKMFLSVFSKLRQQVIWKWESETMPDLPSNVKLSKWLPQQDLLGHKNIRMFITHCGGGGTEEAIFHGVPLIGLPMLGDQPMNAKRAKNLGFLVELDWDNLTEESLTNGIQEILNNNVYREKVQTLSKVFRDQPDQPLQRGVFWVEYVLRHKGAPQLRSAARKLNWIQYHSYDVIAAYISLISGILYITFASLRWIFRKVCGSGKKQAGSPSSKKKKVQ